MAPHVTLLAPFTHASALARERVEQVRGIVTAFRQFPFTLARVGRFEGVVYLAPEPAEPFVRMTAALVDAFPEHPPYDGAFTEIVPHLTVASHDDRLLLDDLAAIVQEHVPISALASSVLLVERAVDLTWETRAAFELRR